MSSKRSRSPRTRPKGAVPEGKSRPVAVARKPEPEARPVEPAPKVPTWRTRLRRYAPSVLITNGLFLIFAIAFALIALTATGTPMAAFAATTAETWMVMHLIPAVGRDQTIAIMPMLPAMLLMFVVARRTYRAVKDKVSLADLGVLTALVLGVPTLVTVAMWAMLLDAAVVYDLHAPNLALAILWTLVVHGASMIIGMRERLWKALARRFDVPAWLVDAARSAFTTLKVLLAVACAMFLVMLAVRHQFVAEATANYTTAGTAGAWALSVAYLPNMAVHALAYLMGSEVLLGPGAASVFGVNMVALPPLPILAGIPAAAPSWALVALLAPAIVLGVRTFRGQGQAWNLRGSLAQACFAALYMLILVLAAGGTLGVYGYVGANVWLTPLVTFLWFAAVLLAGAGIAMLTQKGGTPAGTEEVAAEEGSVEEGPAEEGTSEEGAAEEVVAESADEETSAGDDGDATEGEEAEEAVEVKTGDLQAEEQGDIDPEADELRDDGEAVTEEGEAASSEPAAEGMEASLSEDGVGQGESEEQVATDHALPGQSLPDRNEPVHDFVDGDAADFEKQEDLPTDEVDPNAADQVSDAEDERR